MEDKFKSICLNTNLAKRWLIAYQAVFGLASLAGAASVPFLEKQFKRINEGFANYLGRLTPLSGKKTVWIHGVSMGESIVACGFAEKLKQKHPNLELGFTTTHPDVLESVRKKKLAQASGYFPLDNYFSMNRAFNRWHPDAVFVAETDFWPIFSATCKSRSIPLILINGRISDKIAYFYSKFPGLSKLVFGAFHYFLVQSSTDKDKLIDLGVSKSKIEVSGNMKADLTSTAPSTNFSSIHEWQKKAKLVMFGSIHPNEFNILHDVFHELSQKNVKIIIAPRNLTLSDNWKQQLEKNNLKTVVRTDKKYHDDANIMILNTMGELSTLYHQADVAFVGGSIGNNVGGHNPIEVMQAKTPLIIGNQTRNFSDIVLQLSSNEGAIICQNEKEIFNSINKILKDDALSSKLVCKASKVLEYNQGALEVTLNRASQILYKS